jgi:hypothetical protein
MASSRARRYDRRMATYQMSLFLHPRAARNGDEANETRTLEASSNKEAHALAQADMDAATPRLFVHPEDHIILYDPDGNEMWIFSPNA